MPQQAYNPECQDRVAGFSFAFLRRNPSLVKTSPVTVLAIVQERSSTEDLCFMRALPTPDIESTFGQWKVLGGLAVSLTGKQRIRCVWCECSTCKERQLVAIASLLNGSSKQCVTCGHKTAAHRTNIRHGHSRNKERTPEYQAWKGANYRCFNTKAANFHHYGGRGIRVADEWRGRGGFERFLAHIGLRPSPLYSLERINVDGNYEPGNVRWANRTDQARNKTNTRHVTAFGRTQSAAGWLETLGLSNSRRELASPRDGLERLVQLTRKESLEIFRVWLREAMQGQVSVDPAILLFHFEARFKDGISQQPEIQALADSRIMIGEAGAITIT